MKIKSFKEYKENKENKNTKDTNVKKNYQEEKQLKEEKKELKAVKVLESLKEVNKDLEISNEELQNAKNEILKQVLETFIIDGELSLILSIEQNNIIEENKQLREEQLKLENTINILNDTILLSQEKLIQKSKEQEVFDIAESLLRRNTKKTVTKDTLKKLEEEWQEKDESKEIIKINLKKKMNKIIDESEKKKLYNSLQEVFKKDDAEEIDKEEFYENELALNQEKSIKTYLDDNITTYIIDEVSKGNKFIDVMNELVRTHKIGRDKYELVMRGVKNLDDGKELTVEDYRKHLY